MHTLTLKFGEICKEGRTGGGGGGGVPWHGSRAEKTTNHESQISQFHFAESRKSASKTLFYLVLMQRKVT